jgi:hypothetical protein
MPGIARVRSTWLRTQSNAVDNWTRIWFCWVTGKASTIRSIVLAAPVVWRVPNTKWPVSAARTADSIVSRSRISPTRITSGS